MINTTQTIRLSKNHWKPVQLWETKQDFSLTTRIGEYTDACKLPTNQLSSRVSQPPFPSPEWGLSFGTGTSPASRQSHTGTMYCSFTRVFSFTFCYFSFSINESNLNATQRLTQAEKQFAVAHISNHISNNDLLSPTQVFLDQSHATGVQYSITIPYGHKSTFTAYYIFALKQWHCTRKGQWWTSWK